MAFTLQIIPGYTFAEADPVTIAKLNRMLADAHVQIVSGSLETSDIGNLQVTASKLAETLDLSSKDLTLPANLLPKSGATLVDLGTPDFIGQIGVTTGDNYLFVAKAATANSDWVRTDDRALTSISAAPERVGQIAIVGGIVYFATGTASVDDWSTLGMEWLLLPSQGADEAAIEGTASHMTFYAITKSGQINLWFRRGTAAAEQLTGVVSSGCASEGSPDWDSGWTICRKRTAYDLTDSSAEMFSDTTKNSSTTGVTPASGILNFANYRLCKILIKRKGETVPFDDFITMTGSGYEANNYGVTLFECGGTTVYDPLTPEGGYDGSAAKLWLRTGYEGIWNTYNHTSGPICDWDEKSNHTLGTSATPAVNDALVRIQLWE